MDQDQKDDIQPSPDPETSRTTPSFGLASPADENKDFHGAAPQTPQNLETDRLSLNAALVKKVLVGDGSWWSNVVDRIWPSSRIGKVVICILLLIGVVWWQWNTIRSLPGVSTILAYIESNPIPHASPDQLSIDLVHLAGDSADHQNEDLLLAQLEKLNGVTVIPVDRTIQLQSIGTQDENVAKGQEEAHELLAKSGAQALIWGTVLRHDGRSVMQLRWTFAGAEKIRNPSGIYQPGADLSLPPIFWTDLTGLVALVVETRAAGFASQLGTDRAKTLKPFIDEVTHLLADDGAQWQVMDRASVEFALGSASQALAEQIGDNSLLVRAIQNDRDVLNAWIREHFPVGWAAAQNNLGIALMLLGKSETGTEHLQDAVEAFRSCLQERHREAAPIDWALTQNGLGTALRYIGERQGQSSTIENSVATFRLGLTSLSRQQTPVYWALLEDGLGSALQDLGGIQNLGEAVEAHREALSEFDQQKFPLIWAATEDNLGVSLVGLAHLQEGEIAMMDFYQALASFRSALTEGTRERDPLFWADAQLNLGGVLSEIGQRNSDVQSLQEGIDADRAALLEYTEERSPLNWATIESNIGTAFLVLGELQKNMEALQSSVIAFRLAMREQTREQVPLDWAQTEMNLGGAFLAMGIQESAPKFLYQAIDAEHSALNELASSSNAGVRSKALFNMGSAYDHLGDLLSNKNYWAKARSSFSQALEGFRESGTVETVNITQGRLNALQDKIYKTHSPTSR